ncbi:T9SS type A sorting domain-containing protein [bacterium]|nr:T9SS type A sorting domain-containing protein [bacterium]
MRHTAGFTLSALLLTLTLSLSAYAQPTDTWMRGYDLGGNDSYRAMVANNDGGHTVLAMTDGEIEMIKLDRYGDVEWRHAYAEVGWNFPLIGSLIRTMDGGYSFRYQDGNYKYLVHTDAFGREQWRVDLPDLGLHMVERNGGGYIIVSTPNSPSRVKVSLLDEAGNVEEEQDFSPTGGTLHVGGIVPDDMGNFYIFAAQTAVSYDLAQVYKLNSNGNLMWWRSIEGFDRPVAQSLGGFATADGGAVWYGSGYEQIGLYFFDWAGLAAKLPADGGDPVWVGSFEEDIDDTDDERLVTGVEGADGTVYLAGDLASQPAVLAVDQYGNEQWRYVGPSLGGFPQLYYFGASFSENDGSLHLFGMDSGDEDALQHVFDQVEPMERPTVELSAGGSTEIPANGGTLTSAIHIENPTNQAQQVRIRHDAVLPNGTSYVLDNIQYTLAAGQMIDLPNHQQMVPAGAPAGEYVHRLTLLTANNVKLSSQAYFFTKAGTQPDAGSANQSGADTWAVTELELPSIAEDVSSASAIPTDFAVGAVYPNPFNATARFDITLPDAQRVSVRVFDTLGRQVAEIANANYSAGTHTLTVAPTGLASGVYFLQVNAGPEKAMRKLVYMK